MNRFDSKRLSVILSAAFAAVVCTAFALVGSASADSSARAANATPYVSDYQTRDWCDDYNDVDWDDCDQDWGDDEDYEPPPAPELPPEPAPVPDPPYMPEPTAPTPEPIIYWPAPPKGAFAKLRVNGRTAKAPRSAPAPIKNMIKAANRITRKPYKWGGGHGRWNDSGYDCSGAVSYVLHAGGYLDWSLVSGDLARWGLNGRGRWVQIYANKGHVFMVIAGLRFDTSGFGERGPRWRTEPRFTKGFKLRHPAGL